SLRLVDPRPPRAPLLPYTTLFRSRLDAKTAAQNLARTAFLMARTLADLHITRAREAQTNRKYRVAIECYHSAIDAMKKLQDHKQDRKSTRLNSSHVKISYAVFCLK